MKRFVFTKLVECLWQLLEYLIEDVNFSFHLFSKTKTHGKFKFSINFIVQHFVHFVVQFCAFKGEG